MRKKLVSSTLIITLIVSSVVAVCYLIYKSTYFKISGILVTEPYTEIKKFADKEVKGENIFSLNLGSLKEKISKQYPAVKVSNIRKMFPATIVIDAESKKVLFQVNRGGTYYLVSEDFEIISQVKEGPHPDYPSVRGLDFSDSSKKTILKDFFAALSKADFPYKIQYIDLHSLVNFSFHLPGGLKVIVGYQNLNDNIKRFLTIMSTMEARDINQIDLRFKRPIVSFRK